MIKSTHSGVGIAYSPLSLRGIMLDVHLFLPTTFVIICASQLLPEILMKTDMPQLLPAVFMQLVL